MENPLAIILSSTGLIFLLVGYIQQRFPPKKINHLYGYRTSTSMQSQEVWDFAQQFSARKMIRMGGYITAFGLFSFAIDLNPFWGIGIALTIIVAGPVIMLLQIEAELKKRYPKK